MDLRIIVSRLLAGLILVALDAAVLLAESEGLPVLLLRELELMGAGMLAVVLVDGSVIGIESICPTIWPQVAGLYLTPDSSSFKLAGSKSVSAIAATIAEIVRSETT